MNNLTRQEKERIIKLINKDKPLPTMYKKILFSDDDTEFIEVTKDYKLDYKDKERKEDIIANTPAAPLQKVRNFNTQNSFKENWHNMLIFGDNLMALKKIYEDQRNENKLKTRNKIKLIYIDPPFATKQDFMKDKEKAYRDKLIGAKFIEFLRKRLILLREILADDGSIYVHLDWKKGHYIKAIMDEVFGEHNFLGQIVWKKLTNPKRQASFFGNVHDMIFAYKKGIQDSLYNPIFLDYDEKYINSTYRYTEKESGRKYGSFDLTQKGSGPSRYFGKEHGEIEPPEGKHWIWGQEKIDEALKKDKIIFSSTGWPRVKKYLDEQKGKVASDLWTDIKNIQAHAKEDNDYPTQKPEKLLERIIQSSSEKGDIILDAFAGSGTTLAVSEKLNRKWIGMDSSKLAIYTIQKRLINLTANIGTASRDKRREYERVDDFLEHSKMRSRGLFMVYEKARKGELIVNDKLLNDLAKFLENNMRTKSEQKFSLCCPEDKFDIKDLNAEENIDYKAGDQVIKIGKVIFLISFIKDKNKAEDPIPLESKEFALYNAGIYDFEKIKSLDLEHYRNFVLNLFNVREEKETVYGLEIDGYIGTYPVYIWNYPEKKNQRLDIEYIESINESMESKAGEKFYIIAPITSLDFMQDEVKVGNTTYTILKVPESILLKLMEQGKEGALEQPNSENDVNEVIDAVGYDFISQPVINIDLSKGNPKDITLFNKDNDEYLIKINKFKSNTLASDPSDFKNFETLSMVMIDTDFNGDYFELDKVYWADELVNNELSRLKKNEKDGFEEKIDSCKFLIVRIKEEDFKGNKMMAIFMDKYGNEKKLVLNKEDFNEC